MSDLTINLWDCLTHYAYCPAGGALDTHLDKVVAALGQSSCAGQELRLEPVADGWLLEVFSCYDQRETAHAWWIHIPKDGGRPTVRRQRDPGVVDAIADLDQTT